MENKSDQQKLKMENIPEDGSEEDEEDGKLISLTHRGIKKANPLYLFDNSFLG